MLKSIKLVRLQSVPKKWTYIHTKTLPSLSRSVTRLKSKIIEICMKKCIQILLQEKRSIKIIILE